MKGHSFILLRPWSCLAPLVRVLLVAGLLAGPVSATPERQVDYMGKASEVFSRLYEKTESRTLSNGLRVTLYPRGTAPVFAGVVAVRVGGSDEKLGETGISHMFEHMAFKGTPEVGTSDFKRESELLAELERISLKASALEGGFESLPETERARWDEIHELLKAVWVSEAFTRAYEARGAEGLNATTDSEMTKYFVSLPRSSLRFWLHMERDRIMKPVMRQFYQERDVVMEERRMRYEDDPDGKLYEQLRGLAFTVHPYRNPVIGYPFDIQRLTATQAAAFQRVYYVPGNIAVSLVGDVRPAEDWPLIEQYFGAIPVGSLPPRPYAPEPPQQGERRAVLKMEASPGFLMGYRKVNYPHPDDAPITLMAEMLTDSDSSPLQRELVQRRRLATSVAQGEGPGVAYPNLLMFSVRPRAPHTNEEVLRAFDEVVADFIKSGITEERLRIAKRKMATSYLSRLSSNVSLGLDFATAVLLTGDWHASFEWYEAAMAATVDDIRRVAKQYLEPSQRSIVFRERQRSNGEQGKGRSE
jgi:predicted Zn-dependent peptidase